MKVQLANHDQTDDFNFWAPKSSGHGEDVKRRSVTAGALPTGEDHAPSRLHDLCPNANDIHSVVCMCMQCQNLVRGESDALHDM